MITSALNSKIKLTRALINKSHLRNQEGLVICEGVRLAEEALNSRQDIAYVLYSQQLTQRGEMLIQKMCEQHVLVEQVKTELLHSISDTETSQGILVVLKKRSIPLASEAQVIFIPSEISDPGNLGTMLRTAFAAGVSCVMLPPRTVDGFAPKVMRAAMGAHFYLPIIQASWEEIRQYTTQYPRYLAEVSGGRCYAEVDYRERFVLIIGSEAAGAGDEAQQMATQRISIPMLGKCESLNVAIAASIILFEAVRQRRL